MGREARLGVLSKGGEKGDLAGLRRDPELPLKIERGKGR